MHPLTIWREKNGISLHELGRRAGVGHTQIMRIERGENVPRAATARRIESATDGAVTVLELLGLSASTRSVREDPATFESGIKAEAEALGLDPDAIAKSAIENAIKQKRFEAWIDENKDAFAAHRKDVEENGLWSDGLRAF